MFMFVPRKISRANRITETFDAFRYLPLNLRSPMN